MKLKGRSYNHVHHPSRPNHSNYHRLHLSSPPEHDQAIEGGVRVGNSLRWSQSLSRLLDALSCQEKSSVEEGAHVPKRPPPKGHFVVYVGGKGGRGCERFVIPVAYLNDPLFMELLKVSEAEHGFGNRGGLTIPCDVPAFEDVRTRIAANLRGRRHHKPAVSWKEQGVGYHHQICVA